jgi:AcrR family transcriptional regulator
MPGSDPRFVAPPRPTLPRGPHSLSRAEIVASQRARLLTAAIDAVASKGYVATVVNDVTTRAGVSRRTLYELFEDLEACFLEAYVAATSGLVDRVRAAAEDGTEEALRAYLSALETEPAFARVFLLEATAAGPAVLDARDAAHDALASVLVAEPQERRRTAGVSHPLGRAVLGATNELAAGLLLRGRAAELRGLVPLLARFAAAGA